MFITDDAHSALYNGEEPFLPGEDYDPMYTDNDIGDGPDHEAKPYGWEIDHFEDPALGRANRAMWEMIARRNQATYTSAGSYLQTWGMFAGRPDSPRATDADMAFRDLCWRFWSTHDRELEKRSDRVWSRLCDTCDTHKKAVDLYTRWANRQKSRD